MAQACRLAFKAGLLYAGILGSLGFWPLAVFLPIGKLFGQLQVVIHLLNVGYA